jgi:hypothetical protein
MASTPFQVVSWAPLEPITDEKLDAMVSNDNWLRDNMVLGQYGANGVKRDSGIRIASGLALITSGKSANKSKFVAFNNYFSDSCKPIVTTGIVSASQRQIFATIDGPGSKPQPTRDGFQVHVHVNSSNKKKKISRNFYVSWHALGY